MDSPEHLLECMHWRQHPDLDFPNHIRKISLLDDWYVASSKNCCQTNNPTLFKKDFYLENIAPWDRGGISLEGSIKHFWESSDFKIAHSRGIFKHFRIEGLVVSDSVTSSGELGDDWNMMCQGYMTIDKETSTAIITGSPPDC